MQRNPTTTTMQRTPQQMRSTAVKQQERSAEGSGQDTGTSPALQLAMRIRNEQGRERAAQFLLAMEPFLAPAERSHIAAKIGVSLPQKQPQPPHGNDPFSGGKLPLPQMPFQQNGGDPLQMMQMLSGLGAMGQKGGMGADPASLARLLGSVMGSRQK
ncbi:MAG: hypothetical protein IJO10_09160 [Clostridia bacterium]|nr:hypothetical protein [Clostridia bacterium]